MNWWKKKEEKEKKKRALLCGERGAILLEDVIKCCDGKSNPIRFFSADLILKATNNFSYSNRVCKILWDWYYGKNEDHRMMLVKKHRNLDSLFHRDLAISSMVSGHKNFMTLAGCCLELEYPLLVYYAEKEQYTLINFAKIVSLKRRIKIAEDIATALAYLHSAFSTPFVYRTMDINNILIDKDGVAKLTDFSCCISIPLGETSVTVDRIAGTYGYMDYNYMRNSIVSKETDAYGFGRVMLMLLTGGRQRLGELEGGRRVYPKWVSEFIEDATLVDEIADPKMLENMGEVTEEERYRMNELLLLTERCLGLKGMFQRWSKSPNN